MRPPRIREIVLPLADRVAALLDEPDVEIQASALRVLAKLGDERVTPGAGGGRRLRTDPRCARPPPRSPPPASRASAPAPPRRIAGALAPVLSDESWRRRLAAVEALAALGRARARRTLERARADKNPIVRAAASGRARPTCY